MKTTYKQNLLVAALIGVVAFTSTIARAQDPLPSWNGGAAKSAIMNFVKVTTDTASPQFVPPAERIATFDQDGTLWVEQPMYSQVMYCFNRVGALVKEKPELKNIEPEITQDVYKVLSLEASVNARQSFGGTAPKGVKDQVGFWKERLV